MYIYVNDIKYKLIVCNNVISRFMGLMFKTNIKDIYMFPHCNSIHTFFMKEKIDIIFTDKDNNVIKTINSLDKNKVIVCKKAYNVYELPNKSIEENNIKIRIAK